MSPQDSAHLLATIDQLRLIIRRSWAWPDERDDIALALQTLSLDPYDPDADHPLIDLYRALVFSARTNGMVYLSAEHKQGLAQGIMRLSPQLCMQLP